jgi:Fur family transcriptional regulator, peroxide stress response regulator
MRSPDELTLSFRAAGRKVTPQRQAVFRALHDNGAHPTAEAVWGHVRRTMPTVSLRTVYQVLSDLEELGEIQSVDLGTGSARFDPNTTRHDHFVCAACGRVCDVHAATPADLEPASYPGFEVESTAIVFRGRCPDCPRIDTP